MNTSAKGQKGFGRRRWPIAIAIAAIVAAAVFATCKTIGNVFARRSPEVALRVDPDNALALATLADQRFLTDPRRNGAAAEALALRSLRAQGLNAYALRTLGYVADISGQKQRATSLLQMSMRLSRRDRGTQLWLIEQAASAGDIPAALRGYDIALRTSRSNAELLYPILTKALDDAEIRAAFTPYVRSRPLWIQAFLAYAVANSAHPELIAAMLLGVKGALANSHNGELNERIIQRLLAEGWGEQARQVYLATPGRSPARLTSPALDLRDRSERDGALGWRLTVAANRQATMDVGPGGDPRLHLEATAGNAGRLAEKLLFLPAGRYGFATRIDEANLGRDGALQWRLRCVAGATGREVWQAQARAREMTAAFEIPAGCPLQSLTIDMVGSEGLSMASADLSSVMIHRERAAP